MKSPVAKLAPATLLLCLTLISSGCATTAPPGVAGAPSCSGATLGFEAASITREARTRMGLPADLAGAVVTELLPGGPAKQGGMLENDLVLQIGEDRIATSCDVIDHAWSRDCTPVRVVVRRGGTEVAMSLTPVDALPFLSTTCSEGAATACFRLAWLRWSDSDLPSDQETALVEYNAACLTGSSEACAFQGILMMDAGKPADDVVRVLGRACDLGSGAGCAHLAFMYATGTRVARDDIRATPVYVRACDLGDSAGCYNAGLMFESGRGVPEDVSRAVAYYDEACRGGSSPACTNLGYLYENGTGVAEDKSLAVSLYQRGCDGSSCASSNLRGCVNTGRAYRDGIGVDRDPARAATIFQNACNGTVGEGDPTTDDERVRACSLLGSLYLTGSGVTKDYARGLALSKRGCEANDGFGCYNAAVVFASAMGVPHDLRKAAPYYRRACELDDAESCYELGALYQKGAGVERDEKLSAALFDQACRGGFEKACRKSTTK